MEDCDIHVGAAGLSHEEMVNGRVAVFLSMGN